MKYQPIYEHLLTYPTDTIDLTVDPDDMERAKRAIQSGLNRLKTKYATNLNFAVTTTAPDTLAISVAEETNQLTFEIKAVHSPSTEHSPTQDTEE